MFLMNKSVCAYPWTAAAIRPNGIVIPCCRYPHIDDKNSTVLSTDPRNSDHWDNLRQDMLEGKAITGCTSCYQDEATGIDSMRTASLKNFIPINKEIEKLTRLEVSFSNLCNLACAHCSSFFSSKWYSEDVKANRVAKSGYIENSFNFKSWDLSELTDLKIIGGEPFMEQKQFVSLMNSIDLSKVELQICTNGTILPGPELKSLIEKCKKVYLCISLDGIGSVNDWYRWPSKFNEVIDNMKQFEQWWSGSSNIVFIVHHVINAINAIDLPKFINFMNDNFPRWVIEWDWIRWPEWQELSVLPDTTKENLIDQFKKEEKLFKSKHTQNPYGPTISRLLENRTTAWETAIINMFNMSTERQLDLLSMIPNLKNI